MSPNNLLPLTKILTIGIIAPCSRNGILLAPAASPLRFPVPGTNGLCGLPCRTYSTRCFSSGVVAPAWDGFEIVPWTQAQIRL
ncbi:Hypothetical protein FKW44_010559 [Caligus rogercresseyi]|uniref:Uncharacterized protein n=1 Tax=Caligus rogercresseyi TaxID=217165 RepID=A0A7T8GR58_CALRO|nr:Hypothetical protein FKW44_020954 [Caligus rogercresseyi]QQP39914.1 Hypothetical protein FKW44_013782 [Caligus rogercresseyi]QQP49779.1 Hypothetical protein FKW44_010559 [Caligus rogercresseyi]